MIFVGFDGYVGADYSEIDKVSKVSKVLGTKSNPENDIPAGKKPFLEYLIEEKAKIGGAERRYEMGKT